MSNFERYSAVHIFGVPIDNPDWLLSGTGTQSKKRLLDLMTEYEVSPTGLPEDITDITPFYGANANFRHFLEYSGSSDSATIYLMPNKDHILAKTLRGFKDNEPVYGPEVRTFRMPSDGEVYALAGPGPRFAGKLCLHEMIVYKG